MHFSVGVPMDAAFGGDDDLIAAIADRAGKEAFAFAVCAVALGCVEEVDAGIEGGGDGGQTVGVVDVGTGHAGDGPET
jgi:hypothetical protein